MVLIGLALLRERRPRLVTLQLRQSGGPLVSRDEAESKPAGQTKAQFQKSWDAWKAWAKLEEVQ